MKASAVEKVIKALKASGVSVACYLPDSLLKELYPALDRDNDIRTIRVTNEGEGAGICGGVWLSGKRAVLVMENSGLRASIEPLARMGMGAGIPGGHADELSRRPRREQLVGDPARHDHGAVAAGHAHPVSHRRPGGGDRAGDPRRLLPGRTPPIIIPPSCSRGRSCDDALRLHEGARGKAQERTRHPVARRQRR